MTTRRLYIIVVAVNELRRRNVTNLRLIVWSTTNLQHVEIL